MWMAREHLSVHTYTISMHLNRIIHILNDKCTLLLDLSHVSIWFKKQVVLQSTYVPIISVDWSSRAADFHDTVFKFYSRNHWQRFCNALCNPKIRNNRWKYKKFLHRSNERKKRNQKQRSSAKIAYQTQTFSIISILTCLKYVDGHQKPYKCHSVCEVTFVLYAANFLAHSAETSSVNQIKTLLFV